MKKKKGKLRTAVAAFAAAMSMGAMAPAVANENNSAALNAHFASFDRAARSLTIDFNTHSRMPSTIYDRTANVRIVQMEGYSPPALRVDPFGSIAFSGRHGQAAADIVFQTAQNNARMNIPTFLINDFILYGLPAGNLGTVVRNADIISMSYDANPTRDGRRYRAYLPGVDRRVQNDAVRSSIYNLWNSSSAITIKAAGNSGFQNSESLIWQSEGIANFNDTHLSVGASFMAGGNTIVIPYSSASAPTVVTLNPYHFGFDYSYYGERSDAEFALRNAFYNVRLNGVPPATICSRQRTPQFDGVEIINRYSASRQSLAGVSDAEMIRIREALINCYLHAFDTRDTTALEGTSFTTPYMAGMLAAVMAEVRERYGDDVLTRHDFVVATYLAAQPIWQAQDRGGQRHNLDYIVSPAGIPYNDNLAGFGYVGFDALRDQVMAMAEYAANNPDARTQALRVDSGVVNFDAQNRQFDTNGETVYEIPVQESAKTVRTIIELTFNGSHDLRSDVAYLESPSGERFRITLTRERPNDPYVFAFTNGMFGADTQGTWKIIIAETENNPTTISSARLSFAAVEHGGVIDHAIEQHNETAPAAQEIEERQDPVQSRPRYNPVPR